MNSSIVKSLTHTLVVAVIYIIPLLLAQHAGWQDITVSTILNWLYLHAVALK